MPNLTTWKSVEGVSIPVPPPEHPRLFLRSVHLGDLRGRMDHPVLRPARERLEGLAAEKPQFRAEWNALQYLLDGAREVGRSAFEGILDAMQREAWPGHDDPKAGDISRPIGRMMLSGAIIYDWCHGLLSAGEKEALWREIVRFARLLECGYPPTKQGSVTGHTSEHFFMRDMISAGIAVYDEYPEMYDLAAGRFFREHLPVRNWFYPGHAYHQGSSYGTYRYGSDMFPTWIFDRMGFGNVYHPSQQFVPYQWIYMRRPDGQLIRQGDNYKDRASRGRPWGTGDGGMLGSSYYGDGYVLADWLHNPDIGTGVNNTLFELLWRDPGLRPRPCTDLPLTHYMGFPFGWMIARTAWGADSVIAEMRVNEYNFANHQHLDAGSFQVYYRGALAIDSGIYQGTGGGYGCANDQNYSWRTVAHNSLLVHDPDEVLPEHRSGPTRNDGGQRFPNHRREARSLEVLLEGGYRTGEVVGHWTGPDPQTPAFSYLKGDITSAYSEKAVRVERAFVFMNLFSSAVPAALAVCDRVQSARPEFRKTWLLHSTEEPVVLHGGFEVGRLAPGERGKLVGTALLPAAGKLRVEKVGGPGKEFWVSGENFPSAPREPGRSEEPGAWRIEVSSMDQEVTTRFLNVLQVTDRDSAGTHRVSKVEGDGVVGVRIADRAVLFSAAGERLDREVAFELEGSGVLKVLVTDLLPGTWQVLRNDEVFIPATEVSGEAGVICFGAEAGYFRLRR